MSYRDHSGEHKQSARMPVTHTLDASDISTMSAISMRSKQRQNSKPTSKERVPYAVKPTVKSRLDLHKLQELLKESPQIERPFITIDFKLN